MGSFVHQRAVPLAQPDIDLSCRCPYALLSETILHAMSVHFGWPRAMSGLEFRAAAQRLCGQGGAWRSAPLGMHGRPAECKEPPCPALLLSVRQPLAVRFIGELIERMHGDSPRLPRSLIAWLAGRAACSLPTIASVVPGGQRASTEPARRLAIRPATGMDPMTDLDRSLVPAIRSRCR